MAELLTAAQMRAIEQAAIASGEVTGLELMERAGRGVVEAIFEEWPELQATSHRAVVLCGPGNNGGDGFVVARLLSEWGWEVEVFLYGAPERMPADAKVNYERWRGMGEVRRLIPNELPLPGFAIWVDALFGIGLARPIEDTLSEIFGEMDDHWHHYFEKGVAIDLPSGICADSGRRLGMTQPAALTVTFQNAKHGHYLSEGPQLCGNVIVKDIGLARFANPIASGPFPRIILRGPAKTNLLSRSSAVRVHKPQQSHKYSHGHALILSGPSGRGGAARLAARGALRIGAGLVTVGCLPEAIPEHAARLDAIMLRPVADAGALERVLEDRRITALCLGPGLGVDAPARALVACALAVPDLIRDLGEAAGPGSGVGATWRGRRALVLDADALTLLACDAALFAALHDKCILTPHGGEFARLFPDIAGKLNAPATKGPAYSKVDATREAAKLAGCVVLFKGPDTVIADPAGRCSINSAHYEQAAPWLATAGSGDVLSGFITGLLARGYAPMQAAETAAWLHVECARSFGPGLIAEDLAEQLPAVFRALGV